MAEVQVVVPEWLDDPLRPSGGNVYGRRVCDGLAALGWSVRERAVAGSWPHPSAADLAALAGELRSVPDGGTLLVDGLIGSAAAQVLVPEAERLRVVMLVHLPLGYDPAVDGRSRAEERAAERTVLLGAAAVVTTSHWTRSWLLDTYGIAADRVHVAHPGVEAAAPAPGTAHGGELLCVGALTPSKGQEVLLGALEAVADLNWRCTCVGSLDLDPAFVDRLNRRAERAGIGGRIRFTGALTPAALGDRYARADVVVSASQIETYGMVVTEALAHGLPVIATQVGGHPEALGGVEGGVAGVLVPPDDPETLAGELRAWLTDAGRRERLRAAARLRRPQLRGWSDTAGRISDVLSRVTLNPAVVPHVSRAQPRASLGDPVPAEVVDPEPGSGTSLRSGSLSASRRR